MKFLTRKFQAGDFTRCWPLYFAHSRFSEEETDQIRRACEYLIANGSMQGAVIYDADSPDGEIRAFGASMFMRRSWVEALKRRPRPYSFIRSLVEFQPNNSPILDEDEIAADNAGEGLSLATAMHGFAPKPTGLAEVGSKLVSTYQSTHRGFHLRETIEEIHGPEDLKFCTESGSWTEFSRYDDYYLQSNEPLPNEAEQPILLTATPASCTMASPHWVMFDFSPPVLDLSRRQKHVLMLALEGMSNRAIGAALDLRPASVHNCFRGAWTKLSQHPTYQNMIEPPKGGAGGNRRRVQLLRVLEHHMEELRPWIVRRASGVKGGKLSVSQAASLS
jgi:hypothetical protein